MLPDVKCYHKLGVFCFVELCFRIYNGHRLSAAGVWR
jgi:hypothetical protein